MTRKPRAPRVSAAYSELLREALAGEGRLVLSPEADDVRPFNDRLLRANVLAQLDLLRPAPAAAGQDLVFVLTPRGAALARGT